MEEKQTTAVTVMEKNVSEEVLTKVKELEKENNLQFPVNYSYANAIKSAWLILQETVDTAKKPVLQNCTKSSVANTLLNMVIQGLSPTKKQCYFAAYGNKLTLMRSYMGTVAVTKRLKGVKDVKAYCIFEGDDFEQEFDFDTYTLKITKYVPKFENVNNTKIKGAFAVVLGEKGPLHIEVMNMDQIRAAWNQGYSKGVSPAHKNFTDQMVKKTVINRACKMFINTSDDSDVIIDAFNQAQSVDDDENFDKANIVSNVEFEVKEEIKEKANTKSIDIEPEEEKKNEKVIDVEIKEEKEQQQTIIDENDPGF